jgi:hypothetical protein
MPRTKRGASSAASESEEAQPTIPQTPRKKQRVSLACDYCRLIRVRCSGGRPSCVSCESRGVDCLYTTRTNRRGVLSGYLRALEITVAHLLRNNPENKAILDKLLQENGEVYTSKNNAYGNHLQGLWTDSQSRKKMWRLLQEGPFEQSDNKPDSSYSPDDYASVTQGNTSAPSSIDVSVSSWGQHDEIMMDSRSPFYSRLDATSSDILANRRATSSSTDWTRLPRNWNLLLKLFFETTHTWLPIVDEVEMWNAARAIASRGITVGQTQTILPVHVELWAVLALTSFQVKGENMQSDAMPSPRGLYGTARSMMPSEESRFETAHIRAMLLHSLVLSGRGADLASWMLVGTALRLALYLRETGDLYARDSGSQVPRGNLTLAACFLLNTFTSAQLKQPTFAGFDVKEMRELFSDTTGALPHIPVQAINGEHGDRAPTADPYSPLQAFKQLLRIARVLSACLRAEGHLKSNVESDQLAADLIASIEPKFFFCTILAPYTDAHLTPSSFVVRISYLSTLIMAKRSMRDSLIGRLWETIAVAKEHFGLEGLPPLTAGLIQAVRMRGGVIDDRDSREWDFLVQSMKAVWLHRPQVASTDPWLDASNYSQQGSPYTPDLVHSEGSEPQAIYELESPHKDLESLWEPDKNGDMSSLFLAYPMFSGS